MASGNNERTFIMVKPDGVQRGVVGDVIHRFEQRGYKLVALKLLQVFFIQILFFVECIFILGTKSFTRKSL